MDYCRVGLVLLLLISVPIVLSPETPQATKMPDVAIQQTQNITDGTVSTTQDILETNESEDDVHRIDVTPETGESDVSASEIVTEINAYRRSQGLFKLRQSNAISKQAQRHAENLADRETLSHTSKKGYGVKHRYPCGTAGENLYMSSYLDGAESVIESWEISPGHKRIMEETRFSSVGVGVAQGDDGVYVVAGFCG